MCVCVCVCACVLACACTHVCMYTHHEIYSTENTVNNIIITLFGTESINVKIPNHYVVYQKLMILSTVFQQIYAKEKGIANYILLLAVRHWGYTWVLHAFFNQSKIKKNIQQKWTLCFWVWEWASSVCKLTTRGISVGYSQFFSFDCRKC